jgi:hypothetical protein
MRLPPKKRPGNPILASDWNTLIDALEARTPRPGPGTEIVFSSGGFSFRVKATAASASFSKPVPLAVIGSRPPYIPAPANQQSPTGTSKRYYIEWGTLNNLVAENWDDDFLVSSTTYFFAKATLRTTGTLQVTSWEIATGSAYDSVKTPDWDVGAARPNQAVVLLGTVFVDGDGVHSIAQSGGGSIVVGEHVTMIQPGSGAGEVKIGKELTCHRQAY